MNIGIMGFGHLGQSFANGLLNSKEYSKENLFVTAKSNETKSKAKNAFGINVCENNNELIQKSDIIIISLPAKTFFAECENITSCLFKNKSIISFMAGVKIQSIKDVLGDISVIRAMPNVCIDRCDGIIGYTYTDNDNLINLLKTLGFCFAVDEKNI